MHSLKTELQYLHIYRLALFETELTHEKTAGTYDTGHLFIYLYIKWKNYARCSKLVGRGVSRSTIYGGDQLWEGEQLAGLSKYFSTRNLHF